jgi:hypothetical protein
LKVAAKGRIFPQFVTESEVGCIAADILKTEVLTYEYVGSPQVLFVAVVPKAMILLS